MWRGLVRKVVAHGRKCIPCTVLFIEDNPKELKFWSTALRNCSAHYSVLEAAGSQEGFELLRQQIER
jgi:CheY-like chemotaxis protein